MMKLTHPGAFRKSKHYSFWRPFKRGHLIFQISNPALRPDSTVKTRIGSELKDGVAVGAAFDPLSTRPVSAAEVRSAA
jgi:hypothetical protein